MTITFPLFRAGGTRVRLDPAWALVVGVLVWSLASGRFPHVLPGRSAAAYWTGGLVALGILVASVVVHALAHALVAFAYGMRVTTVTVHVFGGAAATDPEPPHPAADALMAILGPLVSFAIAAGAFAVRHAAGQADWAAALLGYVGLVNAAVGLFNLLPGLPLDGGRLLRALLWWWSGNVDAATRVARDAGVAFGLALVAFGGVRLYARDVVGGLWFVMLGASLVHATRAGRPTISVKPAADRRLDRVA